MDLAAVDELLAPWRAERERRQHLRYRAALALHQEAKREAELCNLGGCSFGHVAGLMMRAVALEARAERLRRRLVVKPYVARLASCDAPDTFSYACSQCGVIEEFERRCGARVACTRCAKAFYAKARRRLMTALAARQEAARAAWVRAGRTPGQLPRPVLMTFTLRHSGDLVADRRVLSAAWHRWHAWYRRRWGNLDYAWCVEVTPGNDTKGHAHLHIATMLPYRDYDLLRGAWERATAGQGQRIHVAQRRSDTKSAAKYLAKYVSKGIDDLGAPELAAAWIVAQHGRRALSTSHGWWLPEDCHHARIALRAIAAAQPTAPAAPAPVAREAPA